MGPSFFVDYLNSAVLDSIRGYASMARIQPVLTPTELALVDQMDELTGSK